MNKSNIEVVARDLQLRIWSQRDALWPAQEHNPMNVLDPALAAHVLGIRFEYKAGLGQFGFRGEPFEVAGILNRRVGTIEVAMRFDPQTVRFTAAHELGHWLLHPDEVMHRDRPIRGLHGERSRRPPREREADYFAACFLMPRKLVTAAFEKRFRANPFVFDDAAAFWLRPEDPDALLRPDEGSLDRAVALASARSYGGGRDRFVSLAEQFNVSVATMAIRLTELRLIQG